MNKNKSSNSYIYKNTETRTHIHTNTNTENLTNPYIYYRYRISDVTMERRTDRLLLYRIEGSDGCNGRTQVMSVSILRNENIPETLGRRDDFF